MGIRRGQPKISDFVKFTIAYKVVQYEKRWNITSYKAWLLLTEKKGFQDLMREHFKNKSGSAEWWTNNMKSPNVKKNFYKNHIRKTIKQFPNLKIYTPKEYKESLARIKRGLGSLKSTIKRVRKPQ